MISYFECSCSSAEHLVRLRYFPEDKDFAYLEVHLVRDTFFKRLIYAAKYIFGSGSVNFAEVLLDKDTATKMRNVINEFLEGNNAGT